MGAAEGTGPNDDPWLRHYRDESRAEGRCEPVLAVLAERGIAVTPDLSARIAALGTLPVAELMRAALRCASEADFLELCAGRTNRAE